MNFYIDESGNTGDLINTDPNFSFGSQEFFSLCCLPEFDASTKTEILALKRNHKIKTSELKASKLINKKPEFINSVAKLLIDKKIPVFIESVEKRFFILTQIIDCLIFPPYYSNLENLSEEEQIEFINFRRTMLDHAYEIIPDFVLEYFITAIKEPSRDSWLDMANKFILFFKYKQFFSENEIFELFIRCINETIDDLKTMERNEKNEQSYLKFLPLPDKNKHGKDVWMLPNLSSFSNIYARINKHYKKKLTSICIYHDEQAQFDEIIIKSKSEIHEIFPSNSEYITPSGLYSFENTEARLSFIKSEDSIEVQVADLLSGMCCNQLKKAASENYDDLLTAFKDLSHGWNHELDTGINFVVSNEKLSRIGIRFSFAK